MVLDNFFNNLVLVRVQPGKPFAGRILWASKDANGWFVNVKASRKSRPQYSPVGSSDWRNFKSRDCKVA